MKECLRKALQKEVNLDKYKKEQKVQSARNLITTCYFLNFVLMIAVIMLCYRNYPDKLSNNGALLSILFYMGASIFETLCEPTILHLLGNTEYEKKVYVEGTGLFMRGAILCALLYFQFELLAYGIAHFLYTLIMLVMISFQTKESVPLFSFQMVKFEKDKVYYLDTHASQLTHMASIGAFRFLLTEGENLALNFTSNLTIEQQGEYSLIANLCSIICRFIFQPLEELSYSVFGKESLKATHIDYMSKLLRHLLFLGMCIISFSYNYAYTVLYILYKEQWTNDSTVAILQVYGVYIFAMGVNGVTEAFAMARSDENQLKTMQKTMTISSVIFVVAMFLLVQIGPTGIVIANILNMITRVVTNMSIIRGICTPEEFKTLLSMSLPKLKTILCILVTFGVCFLSKSYYEDTKMIVHLGVGAINGLLCLAVHFLT